MKRLFFFVLLCLPAIFALGQSIEITSYTLNQEKYQTTPFNRNSYFFKGISKIGDTPNPVLEQFIDKYWKQPADPEISWLSRNWSSPVTNESDAEMVVEGTYVYESGTDVYETIYRESVTAGTPNLPYFVSEKKNFADLMVILNYTYKDGSPAVVDTIHLLKESVLKPGKDYYKVEQLEKQLDDEIRWTMGGYRYFLDRKKALVNLPDVKIKDKVLREEYKTYANLMKEGKYADAGRIAQKLYEAEKTPELSVAVGLCYELLGNFPKAQEYYDAKPDFHIKMRMRKNMELLDAARAMGYEPVFADF
ncbi:hypothetical protein [Mangrovibacterium sp.]|uniref:hypothetical protein n=1 Tax=Mangrovibacterium sp. TaxID=1961364 RepID=UPI0035670857